MEQCAASGPSRRPEWRVSTVPTDMVGGTNPYRQANTAADGGD